MFFPYILLCCIYIHTHLHSSLRRETVRDLLSVVIHGPSPPQSLYSHNWSNDHVLGANRSPSTIFKQPCYMLTKQTSPFVDILGNALPNLQ